MIEKNVAHLAAEFQKAVTLALKPLPGFFLDFTWPSIGLLDYLTFHLRNKATYSKDEEILIAGAAAYIGCMAHDCWSFFPDKLEIKLSLDSNDPLNPILSAHGGKFLDKGQAFQINIGTALKSVLTSPPKTFAFFARSLRPMEPNDNYISPFALGVLTGLSPYGEGPWSSVKVEDFSVYLSASEIFLAHSAATHYRSCYPHEALGQDPANYLSGLILPPAGIGEPGLFVRGALTLADKLAQSDVEDSAQLTFLLNLCSNFDELIATSAFIVLCARISGAPTDRLRWLSERFRHLSPIIGPTISLVRSHLKLTKHWLHFLLNNEPDKARALISAERTLHLLPLCWLSSAELTAENSLPLAQACIQQDATLQLTALNSLSGEIHSALPFRIQRALIAENLGDYASMEELCSASNLDLRLLCLRYLTDTSKLTAESVQSLLAKVNACADFERDLKQAITERLISALLPQLDPATTEPQIEKIIKTINSLPLECRYLSSRTLTDELRSRSFSVLEHHSQRRICTREAFSLLRATMSL